MGSVYSSSREQFELRMRARRAATCLAVARTAIASGRPSEAVERLEEACNLVPDAAEPRLLLEELLRARAEAPPPAPDSSQAHLHHSEIAGWSHWLAAAIAICVLAALAFFWPPARPETGAAGPTRPVRQQAPSVPQPETPAAAAAEPATVPAPFVEPPLVGTTGAAGQQASTDAQVGTRVGAESPAATTDTAAPVTKPLPIVPAGAPSQAVAQGSAAPSDTTVAPPASTASTPAAQAVNVAPATTSSAAAPLPQVDATPVMADDLSRQVPSEAVSTSSLAAPAAMAHPNEAASAAALREAAPDPSDEIADTLRRYAEAYTRLDAGAAHAVWPTVDERALARAFDGLSSQRLVFDHCDVAVKGPDATAACRGRAGYVPKVGSREPLVEQRLWTFRLRRAESGWQITQADAR